ncbi:hypothetical protein DLJ61_17765 [Gordonia terrae]|uniref:Uncharacterized protein n=2 Tax=Gordonia terrae TaxID=2055 RepID=A0AAD0K8F8_9ACTN|nr:hypothetical protein BCM27_17595 [Gordonia terrae]AWO85109.1 hypothetical protein DLJ61_17765 [Gordonia terrae]GAB46734.1 hypothetical protein GOTRE_181_00140 [Gordonia terrae NBRC 100016]VTR10786.1 Uncharacterised protein [Clostridioides difficile]
MVAVLQTGVAVEDALEIVVKFPTSLARGLPPLDDCLRLVEQPLTDERLVLSCSFGTGMGDEA